MGLFDELKKLTQPYGDEDDYFEGAEGSFPIQENPAADDAQMRFENTFAEEPVSAPEPAAGKPGRGSPVAGSIFGNLASQNSSRAQRPARNAKKAAASSDKSVIRFNPKDFDEAGELVTFLEQGCSLIMSLEDLPSDTARRLLDFMSGIAFAVEGKITPVSAKTYFVTPQDVDLLDAQASRSNSDSADDY